MTDHDWVPSATAEADLTGGRFIATLAERYGDREALVFGDVRLTYRELNAQVRAVAKALLANGAGKGTRVALLLANRPELVVALHAVGLVGGVAVPMSTLAAPPERDYVLAHCDAAILVVQEQLGRRRYVEELLGDHPELAGTDPQRSTSFPYLRRVVVLGDGWRDFVADGEAVGDDLLDAVSRAVLPTDEGVIIYTSGTTTHPKAVLHNQRTPVVQHWRWVEQMRITPDDRVWSPFPFFWTAGYTMAMGSTLAAGATLVLQERPDAAQSLALMERERVTTVHAWPQLESELASHPDAATRDLSSLRKLPRGSALRQFAPRADDDWGTVGAYGLTETFTINTSIPADSPAELRDNTHGVALPGITLRIVDPATAAVLPTGEVGEIALKGVTLMMGYYKVPPEEYLDAEGYFRTGDSGWLDEFGYLHWSGRLTGLIKTHGANVSPVELETKLLDWGRLRLASVVGVPHPVLGEAVVLCAVRREADPVTAEDVAGYLRGKVASYKVPRHVLFLDEAELRFTGSQKVQLAHAREVAAQRVAANDPEWAQYLATAHPDLLAPIAPVAA